LRASSLARTSISSLAPRPCRRDAATAVGIDAARIRACASTIQKRDAELK